VVGQVRSAPSVISIDDPQLTSCHLNGLVPGLTYRVTICARTRVGCGRPYTVDLHTPPAGRESISVFLTLIAKRKRVLPHSLLK